MRTSLTEIKLAERYLGQEMEPEEKLLFEAKLLTSPVLRLHVALQRKAYRIVQLFHRAQSKHNAQVAHLKLFNDPQKKEFQQSIHQLFKH